MADSVNLAEEFAPPDTKAEPVDISSEFEAPPKQEQHAVINDATDKAHQWRTAFNGAATPEERKQAARNALGLMVDWLSAKGVDTSLKSAGDFVAHNWEKQNEPLINVPKIEESPQVTALKEVNPQFRLLAGVYNGLAPVASSLTSPINIETMGTFGALQKASQLTGPAGTAAKAALNSLKLYFGAQMAKGAGEAAGAASVDPSIENVTTALASSALAILGGHAAAEGLAGREVALPAEVPDQFEGKFEPQGPKAPATAVSEPVSAPPAAEATPTPPAPKEAPETVSTAAVKLSDGEVVTGKTHGQIVADLGDRDLTGADDGFVTSTGRYVTREEGMKIAKASAQMDESNQGPERLYSEHLDPNQSRPPMKVEPAPVTVADVSAMDNDSFQKFADAQEGGYTAKAHEAGIAAIGKPEAIAEMRTAQEKATTEFKAAMESGDLDAASVLASKQQFFREAIEAAENTGSSANAPDVIDAHALAKGVPVLSAEFSPPEKGSEQHTAITEELAKPNLSAEVEPPKSPTAVMNAVVDQERAKRGLEPAMETESRSDPETWDKVVKRLDESPSASAVLVDELKDNPRAINDIEVGLIRHRQITLQNQFSRVASEIISANEAGDSSRVAQLGLERDRLSNDLLDVYNAGKLAGKETGRGLRARRGLQNEDFSLAGMVTTRRAINEGRPLSPDQMAEITALHEKIAQDKKAFDDYVAKNNARTARPSQMRSNAVTKLISDRASEARARIAARLENALTKQAVEGEDVGGLLSKENLQDMAHVAAEYIAKGIDAGAELVKEFGEKIKPHLKDILDKAQSAFEDTSIEAALVSKKARLEKSIAELNAKIATGDTSTPGQKMNRPLPEELEKLQQQRDEAKAKLDEMRKTKSDPTDEEVLSSKVESLNERIAERKAALESGDIEPKPTAVNRPLPPELEQAKQELEEVNRQIEEARNGPELTPEEKRLKAFKTRTETRIEELDRRTAEGDFTREEKIELAKDEEANLLQARLQASKDAFAAALERDRYENLSSLQKAKEQGLGAYDMARTLMTTGELSFVLRQGKMAALGHPIMTAKTLPTAFRALLASPEAAHAINLEILNHPDMAAARAAKLHILEKGQSLNKQEEFLMAAQLAEKVPLIGKAIRGFNQAAEAFLNKLRFDLWRTMRDVGGLTALEDRQLAKFVNESTGRGTLGSLEPAAVPLGRIMFSPRYFASRLQLLVGHSMWGGTTRTRQIIAKEYARALVGLAAYYGAVELRNQFVDDKDKAKIGTDPRSTDFGKIKLGNTRIDPLAGLSQMVVFGARTATGEKVNAKGKVTAIRGNKVPYGGDKWSDVAANFARSKLHPVPGAIINLFDGTDLAGNKVTVENQALNMAAPLTYMDIYQALKEQDLPEGIALSLLAVLGEGLQTYGKPNKTPVKQNTRVPASTP